MALNVVQLSSAQKQYLHVLWFTKEIQTKQTSISMPKHCVAP